MNRVITAQSNQDATRAYWTVSRDNTERAFLDPAGIPERPWYRHLLYAPKPTYAAEVLPGVSEALEAKDRARLDGQVAALAAALNRAAAVLAAR